ncbi:helix-turn-helix domain-containing protein [Yersinia massiliensis]|uniref:Helix-turn-helix domain-containing protein n=1 Tax=Yersinia massiliensis TaxID=419257 RepID=A0ABM6USH4_9GAMM|nr:helix-turn-helix domain-containing protein [Yersinia massiliensis]AVX37894.1 helix-turn-helix domain-containing protein [Yersinia massiliensis]QKJ12679.1 helix-turn-helix domain-containing protein [Yersinia massiliensis]
MSVKLSSYVWDGCAAAGMKISKVAIMARLADFSNDEGVCWPSVTTISRQIGAGESTVRTALAELETDGWLSRKQRRAGNRNASNVYQLNVAKLKAAAHASESDASNSDGSKSDGSKFDWSESGKNGTFDPPESGGDPSVNSKQDPSNTKTIGQSPTATDPQPVDSLKIDYSAVLEAYHATLPEMPGVLDMTKDRQTKLRALWKKYDLNLEKWSAYLRYISKKCRWMLEDRPDTSSGKTWRRKNFDYLITEKCYLAVKEVRADDLPKVPKMDTVTRQEAFGRLILRHGKAQNTVEKTALSMAGGLGRMNETSARIEWNGIWAKALDQVSENELRRLAS